MTKNLKKYLILGFLFFFPIFVYVFLSTGINNFAKLPVLTYGVNDIVDLEGNLSKVSLKDNISIVGFWGGDIENKKSEALNLNQKIYKRFYEFQDFQFVFLYNVNESKAIEDLKENYGINPIGILSNPVPVLTGPHSQLGVDWFANQTNRLQESRFMGPGVYSSGGYLTKDQTINLYNWNPDIITGLFDAKGFNTSITKKFEVDMVTWDNRVIPMDGTNGNPNWTVIRNSGTFPSRITFTFNLNLGNSTDPIWKYNNTTPGAINTPLSESDTNFSQNQQTVQFITKVYGVRELASGVPQTKVRTYTFRNQEATRAPSDPSDSSHAMGEWKDTVYPEES